MRSLLDRLVVVLKMIKFSHSVFALPFALIAWLLAARDRAPSARVLCWVVVAMVGARSAAMAFNRLVDQSFDAANPRTRDRALPRGAISRTFTWVFVLASLAVFHAAALALNRLCLVLSPAVTLVLLGYSFTKRFTMLSHVILGLALGLAPCGAWLAVRGTLDGSFVTPVLLGIAVLFWVAGFDIIYACQDVDFDRRHGLFSLPARVGIDRALRISTWLHALAVIALTALWLAEGLGTPALLGVIAVALLLWYEHALVKPADLSRVNLAFFNVNGLIGILLFASVLVDLYW
ncbi:MAG: UbiA-like polyprenyltransferase [Planctomycetota bacterium]